MSHFVCITIYHTCFDLFYLVCFQKLPRDQEYTKLYKCTRFPVNRSALE